MKMKKRIIWIPPSVPICKTFAFHGHLHRLHYLLFTACITVNAMNAFLLRNRGSHFEGLWLRLIPTINPSRKVEGT